MRKLGLLFALLIAAVSASAQSLKPDDPYPLKAGINQGTADSFVGTHYWYFYANPGNVNISVRLRSAKTALGASIKTTLTITLTNAERTWKPAIKYITGQPNLTEATFGGKIATRTKALLSVAPPSGTLLRTGGEYEIEVNGTVDFGQVKETGDPIVRTYDPKTSHYSDDYGAVKFNADGTIVTANGFTGTWRVFDTENRVYAVQLGRIRYSLQYIPGSGLVEPGDPTTIRFQELRR